MKATIEKSSKNKSKYDNEYFDINIEGLELKKIERSEVRHLIQILDNGISN